MNSTRSFQIKRRYKVLGMLSGILLGIPLLCIGVFVFGAYYGQWRMAEVNHELFALAEQLEYTPDALLQHRVKSRDHNIVFPGNAYCDAHLYFTTPLDPVSFTQKLNQAEPKTIGKGTEEYSNQLLSILSFNISETEAGLVQEDPRRAYMTSYYWHISSNYSGSIRLYKTSTINIGLEYKGRHIQDNIVGIYRSGGAFPIWMNCPTKTTESGTSVD
jgi:hypothetical protein